MIECEVVLYQGGKTTLKISANAKLNLYLKVVGKRSDGYHLLNMINVPVSIFDEMTIEFGSDGKGLEQRFTPGLACRPERTTIYKAFALLKDKLPSGISAKVAVKKNIPEGSGMGGGSGDAAVFIKAVTEKYNIPVNDALLNDIARHVGADVPFFMFNKPAWLEGIGERVFTYDAFPRLNFLVISPDFGISTAWAYSKTKIGLTKKPDNINLKNPGITFDEILKAMENDLEVVAEKEYSNISVMKRFLRDAGAIKAMMTGSGSAVFGIFENIEDVNIASMTAKSTFPQYKIFPCTTIGA